MKRQIENVEVGRKEICSRSFFLCLVRANLNGRGNFCSEVAFFIVSLELESRERERKEICSRSFLSPFGKLKKALERE